MLADESLSGIMVPVHLFGGGMPMPTLVTDPAQPSLADQVIGDHPHLRLNTSHLSAAEAAEHILAWLGH